jgi:caffeoyl-CoA O-methyltransferase
MLATDLDEYVRSLAAPLDPIASELISETATMPMAGLQIAPEQGTFLKLLVQLTGARSVLEIGTFTGFSALCMARGLSDGKLIACDVNEEWTAIARRYWERAGVADRIDLRIGPALDTLGGLPDDVTFDLAFIDADKPAYPAYFEAVADRMRPGGLLLA